MTPFERLIQDLKAEQKRRADAMPIFFKAMPDQPVDVLAAVKRAKGKAEDRKIAGAALDGLRRGAGKAKVDAGPGYDPAKMIRALIDADHRRALLDGDMARATRAIETGKPIPRDVLKRINGGAK
ncbi:hypothetical protein IST455A_01003 [Burkholderia multivorans]|uniref:hypothetical protein n=1 Tax=Burkholderia multivorans TaxID=87883 RepID=UPI00123934EE|nr:hypothetical protein [Burkholderia multivorans]MBU9247625.1 hypothetical protein [Burkholderia multivorans]QET31720.1 hypothetical protein FOB31_18905 [Burkholderia multivorans]QET40860.1 hypothetical protein FOB30_24955 [Burkholderia multivorans]CAB5280138.1 hypothetical protein IST495A_03480 [Burkholderia multivorans]CAB5300665.1 hypothetical protein IST419_01130 [Burkholderia multivorans]